MLGSRSGGSGGWRISAELHSPLASGSLDMDPLKATRNVWGAEEAFLSPPEYAGLLAASLESEESSEDSSEDYVCGLAEEIAQSMLQEQEAEKEEAPVNTNGPWGIAAPKSAWSSQTFGSSPTSPQSTLSGVGGYHWEVRSNKGSSGMSSPPTPQENEPMEALYEELLRLKLEDPAMIARQSHILSSQQQIIQRPCPASPNVSQSLLSPGSSISQRSFNTSGSRGRCMENHVPKDNVLALAIDRAMMVKQGRQQARSKGGSVEVGGGKQVGAGWGGGASGGGYNGRRGGHNSSNSVKKRREEQQQQQHQFSLFASNVGGGAEAGPMRAVFLGAPASRECGGTGVFLPRRLGSTHHHQDSKRKPACSTVLLPSHIVQALNLNVEDTLPSYHRRDNRF